MRPLRSRLAGLALLLQVLVAFGATRGLVLCVGPAGHVAVEDYDAASRCRESYSGLATDAATGLSVLGAHPACVDTPILGVAGERSTSLLRFATVTLAISPTAELPLLDAFAQHVDWTQELPLTIARILRSVVLLI